MARAMRGRSLRVTLREATGNAIVDAAEHVAARDGLSGAHLQAIAEQAGVAVGTIYNYFEDKDRLFGALFARRRAELFAAVDAAAKEHRAEPFADQLSAFIGAVLEYFDVRRAFLGVALEAERMHSVAGEEAERGAAMQQLMDRAERLVRLGLREKALRRDGADLLAAILVAIVRGVLSARAVGDGSFASRANRVTSIFLHGAAK